MQDSTFLLTSIFIIPLIYLGLFVQREHNYLKVIISLLPFFVFFSLGGFLFDVNLSFFNPNRFEIYFRGGERPLFNENERFFIFYAINIACHILLFLYIVIIKKDYYGPVSKRLGIVGCILCYLITILMMIAFGKNLFVKHRYPFAGAIFLLINLLSSLSFILCLLNNEVIQPFQKWVLGDDSKNTD